MKRTLTYIFLCLMVALFATVLYLLASALFTQEKEFGELVEKQERLARETDKDRSRVERLAEELLEQEIRLKNKLDHARVLLDKLARENEQAIKAELSPPADKPDQAEVQKLAKLPVPEIVSQMRKAIGDSDRLKILTCAAALRENRDEAFIHLTEAIASASTDAEKQELLEMLSHLRDPRALNTFQDVLKNETEAGLRQLAAIALMKIPDRSSVPLLVDALRTDTDWRTKTNAAAALGVIRDPRAVEPLKKVYIDGENSTLRLFALAAISLIADPATTEFLAGVATGSEIEDHRRLSVAGLDNIATPEAIAVLRRIASEQTGLAAQEARWALEKPESPGPETKGESQK